MSHDLTPEETKIKAEARDALIKHVFDNLRNVLICATLGVGGVAIIKHSSVLALGSMFNTFLGFFVLLSAIFLLAWNMGHGIERVTRPLKGKRNHWLAFPFAVVYALAVLAVFHAWSLVQVQLISYSVPYAAPASLHG